MIVLCAIELLVIILLAKRLHASRTTIRPAHEGNSKDAYYLKNIMKFCELLPEAAKRPFVNLLLISLASDYAIARIRGNNFVLRNLFPVDAKPLDSQITINAKEVHIITALHSPEKFTLGYFSCRTEKNLVNSVYIPEINALIVYEKKHYILLQKLLGKDLQLTVPMCTLAESKAFLRLDVETCKWHIEGKTEGIAADYRAAAAYLIGLQIGATP